jgi:hypothetical protein
MCAIDDITFLSLVFMFLTDIVSISLIFMFLTNIVSISLIFMFLTDIVSISLIFMFSVKLCDLYRSEVSKFFYNRRYFLNFRRYLKN